MHFGLRTLGSVSAMLLSMSSSSMAQTLYVDDNDPSACACLPASRTNPNCGTSQDPFSCIGDAVAATGTFTEVTVRDGDYFECIQISKSGIVVAAESPAGALIDCPNQNAPAVRVEANNVTLRNFRIRGGFYGVHILGAASGNSVGNGNVVEDSEIFENARGVHVERNCSGTRLTRLEIHHNAPYDGVKLDAAQLSTYQIHGTVLEDSHLHHNVGGVYESSGAEGTIIRRNEIDNNGLTGLDHGLYMKGFEGLIQDNKIHHNSGHGITLWAAPRGSSTKHYIAERNDVYGNGAVLTYPTAQCSSTTFERRVGAGISVGGNVAELSLPGNGLPINVEVRYNTVHHNIGPGLYYLVGSCTGTDDGNVFHHNTVYDNVQELLLIRAAGTKVRIKNNIFGSSGGALVEAYSANLAANALNGNVYEQPGAGADSNLFLWNGLLYSFNEIRSTGVLQSPTCGTTLTTPAIVDSQSQWSTDVRLVDPTMALWSDPSSTHHGDFHLRIGSPAKSNGICCPESSGGTDIDEEVPSACSPQDCQTHSSVGVGADFYLDTDADGTADRWECSSYNATTEVCEVDGYGDGYTQLVEEYYCDPDDYPGAPYDPAVYPPMSGPGEICDGKDNDCDPATSVSGGELDVDADGFFQGCSDDVADDDARTFPGSQQVCDGKNNDSSDPSWPAVPAGETDADHDGYFAESPICNRKFDCDDSNCAVNPEAPEICNGVDDDCDNSIDEVCCAGNSGLLNPTSQQADTGGGFEHDPNDAFANDSFKAKDNGPPAVEKHRYYGYPVSIPIACQVKGIEVRLDWWANQASSTVNMGVELSWDGGATWTAAKVDTPSTTIEKEATLGSSTDTWGRSWTAAELSAGNLRVRVTTTGAQGHTFYLDWVPVRVTWGP